MAKEKAHGGEKIIVCKVWMCITMTMKRWGGKQPLIGTFLPWGPHSHLIGHPFTRQRHILCRQSANYRLHNRRPVGSKAVFTSPASQARETTLSQSHNYDEYEGKFTAMPLILVMWGGLEMAIHEKQTAWPCLRRLENDVKEVMRRAEREVLIQTTWTFISVRGKG